MPGNSFGTLLRLATWGESHGSEIGGVLDGYPAGITIDIGRVQAQLDRRRPGQSALTTQRKEGDEVRFLSGLYEGQSLGTPIGFSTANADKKSADYDHLKDVYRPSHADYVYDAKYGHRDHRGGGRSSARETWGRVVAGTLAEIALEHFLGASFKATAWVGRVADIRSPDAGSVDRAEVDASPVRCPDAGAAASMEEAIRQARKDGDSLGGVVHCRIEGIPPGLGEPVFAKLDALLAQAMISLPAAKGFSIGSGFEGIAMRGSEHNDPIVMQAGRVATTTNRSGGIVGGISNGEAIEFRVAFKPTATIQKDQSTVNKAGEEVVFKGRGRHDPCVVPRAVPIVEAMAALVLLDAFLMQRARHS